MTTNQELIAIAQKTFLNTYKQAPIVLVEGKGCRVKDVEGRSYLDLCAGVAVMSVGYGHPHLVKAIADQAARLMHGSNLFYSQRTIELSVELQRRTGFSRFFFCTSGAEANEGLLKIARRWHFEQGDKERTEFVSAQSSFHGRTLGALSITGQPRYHDGLQPLIPGCHHVPYNDLEALQGVVSKRTAAVVLELVQGEGGVSVANDEYVRAVRKLCDERGALLMFDEVQTGYGRTGRFLAREYSDVMPDACALAKGIAGGFPLGVMGVTEKLAGGLPPGSHGSTFGGNPLGSAAAIAVLEIFDRERLVENAATVGTHLGKHLETLARLPAVSEARGRGLLRGLKLQQDIDPLATLAKIRERGVLLSVAGGDVLRFTPPLCITASEIDEGIEVVQAVLEQAPRKA